MSYTKLSPVNDSDLELAEPVGVGFHSPVHTKSAAADLESVYGVVCNRPSQSSSLYHLILHLRLGDESRPALPKLGQRLSHDALWDSNPKTVRSLTETRRVYSSDDRRIEISGFVYHGQNVTLYAGLEECIV
eukprot:scaffold16502_cov177-Amphora_coffeaeformis.AAC.3